MKFYAAMILKSSCGSVTHTERDWFSLLVCFEQSGKQSIDSCLDYCDPQSAVRRMRARWLELASARTCRTSEATPMDRLYIHVSDVEAGARVWPRVSSEGFVSASPNIQE